jgi:hypothetical protein
MRRVVLTSLVVGMIVALAAPGWAQRATSQEEEKQIVKGPSTNSFGRVVLILPDGAESEVEYQPETNSIHVKTIRGEARIITSARYLILVETVSGQVEIRLASGRVIKVEPGKAEIVGAALVDDPGQTIVRLNGTGPFVAQATPGAPETSAEVRTTVLSQNPAGLVAGNTDTTPGPINTPTSLSRFTTP